MVGQFRSSCVTCFRRTFSIRPFWRSLRPFAIRSNFQRCLQVRTYVLASIRLTLDSLDQTIVRVITTRASIPTPFR